VILSITMILILALLAVTTTAWLSVYESGFANLHSSIHPKYSRSCNQDGRTRGIAIADSSLVLAITTKTLGFGSFEESFVSTTELHSTSPVHVDYYKEEDMIQPVSKNDVLCFLFLETNDDAHFNHGETCVPVVAGNIVSFDGSTPHNTVIRSGSVSLLGPLNAEELGWTVGRELLHNAVTPTSAPTSAPTNATVPTSATPTAPTPASSASTVGLGFAAIFGLVLIGYLLV